MTATAAPDHIVPARALWITAPRTATIEGGAVRPEDVETTEAPVLVNTCYTAISRGTERLVYNGLVPTSEHARMRAPFQSGDFTFPVKYGYANVGRVAPSPAADHAGLSGHHVFGLYPHQTAFYADPATLSLVPDSVPVRRAVLAANMETALNACWDAAPLPGDRIAVVGCGLVGALIVYLCARIPGVSVLAVETDSLKAEVLQRLGAASVQSAPAEGGYDLVFHASATQAGLHTAISLAEKAARIVELSWYGDQAVSIGLGGRFHALRLQLHSSQVGTIPPAQAARWSFRRRLATALELLADDRLDALLSPDASFDELPDTMATVCGSGPLHKGPAPLFCQVVRYP
ncbi:zinc-binding alcohol dehydrogenase [Allohahella marinimesophila]|uniref:Zinc-binding alcohol dehydrogenase n=1 Tax=Allohahella marinimesophila TaxID=1054972 RepID=A0ABP7NKJ6_9GAMM